MSIFGIVVSNFIHVEGDLGGFHLSDNRLSLNLLGEK
jgi:hypothetical protein